MVEYGTTIDLEGFGLEVGTPSVKSVGSLAFGTEGILFVGDNVGAAIFAIDVADPDVGTGPQEVNLENFDASLAAYLGCSREDVSIIDMAVHPKSDNLYFSVMRGSGDAAVPVIIKVNGSGVISDVSLENVAYSQTIIKDAADEDDPRLVSRQQLRTVTVTDMSFVDGLLLVAGTSNEEFSSTLRRLPFPFNGDFESSSLEIFHVSHGQYETAAPIRAFVPYQGNQGNQSILASYTCTPVVQFSLGDFEPGKQIKGKTVAELGAHNRPLDLVSYKHGGGEFLLVCNERHPLFKIACKDIDQQDGLTVPDRALDNNPADPVTPPNGVPRQLLPHPGVKRMANLNGSGVLMLQEDEEGHSHLRSYATDTL